MKKILSLLSILISISLIGQTGTIKKADKYYNNYSYPKVIEKLEDSKVMTGLAQRELAESYKIKGDYHKADSVYSMLVHNADRIPADLYSYSQVLKMNGKYDEAKVQMEKYILLKEEDSRSKLFVANKNYVIDLLKDKGQFDVKNIEINSPQQDFGTAYFKEEIVYASSKRDIGIADRKWNGNKLSFLDLYSGKVDENAEIKNPKKLSAVNKKYHEGPASYTKDGLSVMYTQDNYKEKSSDGTRKLEMIEYAFKDGKWTDRKPFALNNKEYSVGHPSFSADGKTLYFSSDMPGGKGGVDIYRVTRNADGTWGTAENLGDKINTEGNEMFPFIHESGLFLFSSDGRPGIGGLDIFATEIKNNVVRKVINAGVQANSSKDDFAMVLDSSKTKGYFSSNREGGKGDDDIYSFKLLKPFVFGKTIKGVAKDLKDSLLANTMVKLYDVSGTLIDSIETTENGEYLFDIDNAGDYRLSGKKEKYYDAKNLANVTEESDITIVDLVLEKDPGLSLLMMVTEADTKSPLEGVKVTMVDENGKPFTDFVTPVTGDYKRPMPEFKVGDKLNYFIRLEKSGYLTKTVNFSQTITKAGEIKIHDAIDLSLGKLNVGGDLAKLIDIKPIYFDLGKFNIRKDAAVELDKIVKVMNEYPSMVIELGSHTDCRASAKFNEKLSDKRAKASAAYIKKSISKPERIYGKGYGESKLKNGCACEGTVKSTCTEDEHQANRRTEFIIIKLD